MVLAFVVEAKEKTVGPVESVRTCMAKYVSISGRASRSEYWWFTAFTAATLALAVVVDELLGTASLGVGLWLLFTLLPGLTAMVRRLHDTGRSGWWLLIGLVPLVGAIVLLVFFCTDSAAGHNRWGAPPKYQAAGY